METGWKLIYSVDVLYKAELLKEKLEEEGIVADIIDKTDSFLKFGDIELYVREEDEVRAKELVAIFGI